MKLGAECLLYWRLSKVYLDYIRLIVGGRGGVAPGSSMRM